MSENNTLNEEQAPEVLPSEQPVEAVEMRPAEAPRKESWLARLTGRSRKARQMATLQQGFSELVGLTRAIREHMDQQARTQQALVGMMTQLPGAVEGLKKVGDATRQQTETLGLIKQQLETSARNEVHLVHTMNQFNKTLEVMDDLSKSTSQTVTSMAARTQDSEEQLRAILDRSERRMTWMIGMLMVVTLAVLVGGFYLGWGERGSPPPALPPPPMLWDVEPAGTVREEIAPVVEEPVEGDVEIPAPDPREQDLFEGVEDADPLQHAEEAADAALLDAIIAEPDEDLLDRDEHLSGAAEARSDTAVVPEGDVVPEQDAVVPNGVDSNRSAEE